MSTHGGQQGYVPDPRFGAAPTPTAPPAGAAPMAPVWSAPTTSAVPTPGDGTQNTVPLADPYAAPPRPMAPVYPQYGGYTGPPK